MSENPGVLSLWSLPRNSHFRVVHNCTEGKIHLSTAIVYRLASTMADSGRTMIVEEAVPLAPGQQYAYRRDAPIRIPRENAKTIAVYRVR